MSTTETLQPTSFESIPLQTLTRPAILPTDTEDDQPDTDTAQARQESREPQIGVESSTPAEALTEHAETPSTELNSALDKWHLRLNATQVLVGVLAFAGFLAMIKFTIIDHYINNDSLKLSQWTAWMTFRDECRALLSETRDIGPDCRDVLYQPLSKPPIPMAESPSHDEKNIALAGRTTRDNASTRERLSALHVLGVSIAEPTLLYGISVLLLVFGLGCAGYVATRRLFTRRKSRRIDTHHAWVPNHVARLYPDGSKGYATAQNTVSWSGTLRKRVFTRKITRIEEQYEESAIYRSFRKRPNPSTDTELLLENWDEASQHDENKEDEGSDHESAWLPTARSTENEERLSPFAYEYLRMVKLILAELAVLGCDRFAFDRVDEHAGLEPFWTTARQEKCSCEFSHRSAFSALVQEISTSDFIFPKWLSEELKAATAFDSAWLVEIPKLNCDSVTRMVNAGMGRMGTWKYWQSGKLGNTDRGLREVPCLRLIGTRRHTRLIFENVTIQDYSFILDRLELNNSSYACMGRLCIRHMPSAALETSTEVMKKVMFAASEDLFHAHATSQSQWDGGLIFVGRFGDIGYPVDQTWERLKLIPMEQEDDNDSTSSDKWSMHFEVSRYPSPLRIWVERAEQPQDSLLPDTLEPASSAPPTTSRRRIRQTIAAWARVRFRRKARNEAEPSAAVPR